MPSNPAAEDLRDRLDGFVRYRKEHLSGDEKGEAAIFLENLFRALGHEGVRQAGATLEKRVKKRDNGGTAYADLEWKPRVLIEMKKARGGTWRRTTAKPSSIGSTSCLTGRSTSCCAISMSSGSTT